MQTASAVRNWKEPAKDKVNRMGFAVTAAESSLLIRGRSVQAQKLPDVVACTLSLS